MGRSLEQLITFTIPRVCHVHALDLRAGAALVIAGLAAEGVTEVEYIHFIE